MNKTQLPKKYLQNEFLKALLDDEIYLISYDREFKSVEAAFWDKTKSNKRYAINELAYIEPKVVPALEYLTNNVRMRNQVTGLRYSLYFWCLHDNQKHQSPDGTCWEHWLELQEIASMYDCEAELLLRKYRFFIETINDVHIVKCAPDQTDELWNLKELQEDNPRLKRAYDLTLALNLTPIESARYCQEHLYCQSKYDNYQINENVID